jgi:hypothetical protein
LISARPRATYSDARDPDAALLWALLWVLRERATRI